MTDTDRDPARDKARDTARQRKIAANSSDKAARKHAPRIKAGANRKLRRDDKAALRLEPDEAAPAPEGLKARARHWGSDNAAGRREGRAAERALLDAVPVGEGPRGRIRVQGVAPQRHEP